jgi:hypothetical protein
MVPKCSQIYPKVLPKCSAHFCAAVGALCQTHPDYCWSTFGALLMISQSLSQYTHSVLQGDYNSQLWQCNTIIDPVGKSCKLLVNQNVCQFLEYEQCINKFKLTPYDLLVSTVFTPLRVKYRGEAWASGLVSDEEQLAYVVPRLQAGVEKYPALLDYIELLKDLAASSGRSFFEVDSIVGPKYPSFTEDCVASFPDRSSQQQEICDS